MMLLEYYGCVCFVSGVLDGIYVFKFITFFFFSISFRFYFVSLYIWFMFCTFLLILLCMFRFVYSDSLCCSVYLLCVNVYCTTAARISGHFSTTLTEGFSYFSSVVRQMPGYNSQRRGTAHGPHFPFFSFYYVCSVPCILCTVCV
jgi:hypothetical protein